jgi:hypothetical protein
MGRNHIAVPLAGNPVYRIRIESGFIWSVDPYPQSGSRRAKMTHKNSKNQEISCFVVLDVLVSGLKALL